MQQESAMTAKVLCLLILLVPSLASPQSQWAINPCTDELSALDKAQNRLNEANYTVRWAAGMSVPGDVLAKHQERAHVAADAVASADKRLGACRATAVAVRQQRLDAVPSRTLPELLAIPEHYRLPEEDAAISRLQAQQRELDEKARQEAELARQQAADARTREEAIQEERLERLRHDPKVMRAVLSAVVCQLTGEVSDLNRKLADHLAHPTAKDDFNEATTEMREQVYQAAFKLKDMKLRMRQARMAPLPCAGEIKKLAACIPDGDCGTDKLRDLRALAQ